MSDNDKDFKAADYWESRLSERYDLQGVGDIGLPVSYNQALYDVRASAFRYMLKSLDGRVADWSVLDVGSGTGFYVNEWHKRGPARLTGSDITETAVGHLSGLFPGASFVQCDIGAETLPEPLVPGSFDVVTAYDMLFHIVDDAAYARAIGNFATLVRDGGYFVFSDNLSDRVQRHGPHQVSRAEADVRSLLAENGFTVQKIIPMFVFMNDPVRSRSRVLRRLFNLIYRLAARGERWGRFMGTILYPVEVLALRVLRRGPSTEIFVCRKAG